MYFICFFLSINGGLTMIFHFEGNGSHKVPSAVPRAPSGSLILSVRIHTSLAKNIVKRRSLYVCDLTQA